MPIHPSGAAILVFDAPALFEERRMNAKLLVAVLGGVVIGTVLSRQFPLITVIVNVGNQGSIDIKVENTEPETADDDAPPAQRKGA